MNSNECGERADLAVSVEMCDLKTGQCGPAQIPGEEVVTWAPTRQTQILFITDPYCSHCWSFEPVWRKFLFFYRPFLSIRYIYGGLLPSWDGFSRGGITCPADLVPHFAEVSERYGQPIDSSIQVSDPPYSSYPASIAIHIVRAQDPEREDAYLRRLRQALFLEARNFARPEVLADCAADIGLDRQRFLDQFQQGQGQGAFQRDLQEAQQLDVAGFPTLLIKGQDQQAIFLRGIQSFSRLEKAFLQLAAIEQVKWQPSVQEVLHTYGSGTTREFDEILGLGREITMQLLTSVGARKIPLAGDALWSAE